MGKKKVKFKLMARVYRLINLDVWSVQAIVRKQR